MGNSLFDQLKKSGLIDEKKAKQIKKEKHQLTKQQKSKKSRPLSESKQRVQQAQAEKVARDRKLNQEQKKTQEQQAIAAQIKQLIKMNRIDNSAGNIRFNFTDGNKVQRLYVTKELQDQLTLGSLAIIKVDEGYELVPASVAEKISQRDETRVLSVSNGQPKDSASDDPYADFTVPDDLMW